MACSVTNKHLMEEQNFQQQMAVLGKSGTTTVEFLDQMD